MEKHDDARFNITLYYVRQSLCWETLPNTLTDNHWSLNVMRRFSNLNLSAHQVSNNTTIATLLSIGTDETNNGRPEISASVRINNMAEHQ